MGPHNFKEEDKQKFVSFLNFITDHAEFKVNTKEIIEYFKLLSAMQSSILPKIEANILEISKIVEMPKEESPEKNKEKVKSK